MDRIPVYEVIAQVIVFGFIACVVLCLIGKSFCPKDKNKKFN